MGRAGRRSARGRHGVGSRWRSPRPRGDGAKNSECPRLWLSGMVELSGERFCSSTQTQVGQVRSGSLDRWRTRSSCPPRSRHRRTRSTTGSRPMGPSSRAASSQQATLGRDPVILEHPGPLGARRVDAAQPVLLPGQRHRGAIDGQVDIVHDRAFFDLGPLPTERARDHARSPARS